MRLAQYETGSSTPKADLTTALVQSPRTLSASGIDSYVGFMHTLFATEDNYRLKINEMDGEVSLKFNEHKNKDAARLHDMLCSKKQVIVMSETGEISKEDYDKWCYRYPEFDKAQSYVNMPSQ